MQSSEKSSAERSAEQREEQRREKCRGAEAQSRRKGAEAQSQNTGRVSCKRKERENASWNSPGVRSYIVYTVYRERIVNACAR